MNGSCDNVESSTKYNTLMALLIVSILFTYNRSDILFYINWILGLLLIAFSFIYISKNKKINRGIVKTWLWATAWLVPVILFTPVIMDKRTHITYILIVLFYTTISSIFVYVSTKTKGNFLDIFYKINVMWVPVNLSLLIIYIINQEDFVTSPFSGVAANRNAFALVTTFIVSILIYFLPKYSAEKIRKIRILIILNIILILATLSLKGVFGIFTITVLTYLSRKTTIRKILIVSLLVVISIGTITTDNQISKRIDRFRLTINNPNELSISESAYERKWLINESLSIISEKPITGIGVNNSIHYLITPYNQIRMSRGEDVKGTYSHNNYIEMLLNGGMLAFLLYYLPLIIMLIKVIKDMKTHPSLIYLLILIMYMLMIHIGQVAYFDFINIYIYILVLYGYKAFKNEQQMKKHIGEDFMSGK